MVVERVAPVLLTIVDNTMAMLPLLPDIWLNCTHDAELFTLQESLESIIIVDSPPPASKVSSLTETVRMGSTRSVPSQETKNRRTLRITKIF